MIKLSPAWQERGGVTWGWPRTARRRWCISWGWRSTRCSLTTSSRVWSGTRRTGRNSWWLSLSQPRSSRQGGWLTCASESAWRGKYVFSMNENHFIFLLFFVKLRSSLLQSIQIQSFHSYTTGCPKKRVNSVSGNFLSKEHKNSKFFWKNGR